MAAEKKKNSAPGRAPAKRQSTAGKKSSSSKKKTGTAARKTSTGKTSGKTSGKRVQPVPQKDYTMLRDILLILLAVFCIILFLSCFITNGNLMQFLHTQNFKLFGLMAYVVPVLILTLVIYLIRNRNSAERARKCIAGVCAFLSIESVLSILYDSGLFSSYGGGTVGNLIYRAAYSAFGMIGSYVLMAAILMISMLLFFGPSAVADLRSQSRKAYDAVNSQHQVKKGQREIKAQEKLLSRQKEQNRILEEQRLRLEELKQQRQLELERANVIREFVDIKLEETRQQEEEIRRQQKTMEVRRELRTNMELEQEDRGLKEITLSDLMPAGESQEEIVLPTPILEEEHSEEIVLPRLILEDEKKEPEAEAKKNEGPTLVIEGIDYSGYQDNPMEIDMSSEESEQKVTEQKASDQTAYFAEDTYESALGDQAFAIEPEIETAGESGSIDADVPGDEAADYGIDTQSEDIPRTKTVTTASGKVITVELDGLPGENKRPRDPVKVPTRMDQYDEKIVPMEYEEPKEYVFPPLSLLKAGTSSRKGAEELARSMKETAMKLQQTLQDFGVGVTITNISRGPSVTRYELQPEQGVKVSKIVSLTDDIKLNLAAEDIRMEAPIPGKAAIGIEVPNKEKQMVVFRELLESEEFSNAGSKTVFAVGKDIAGKTVVADIEKMPHMLIAGQTGSGKSVCVNTIIMSILYKAKPSEVKLIMIDPKVVELSVYNGIPHLLIPVVTDPKKAAAALNWAVNEMEERYRKFAQYKARNIKGYNAAVDQIQDVPGKDRPEKIPQIIVIVDELADLIMTAAGDVEDAIQKLAQKARAAGIHLIIATQRPSVNVITGVIKANIPSRIAFSVASGVDSRTILDEVGAEKLLGKGDMLFHPYYVSKSMRVQGAFVSDEEVSEVVEFLVQQKNVIGGQINKNIDLQANMPGVKTPADEQDELFATAGSYLIETEKASIGNLQRQFRIGFNRAARIMDQLYAAGVVSKDEGTKPRKVLMTAEQFDAYLDNQK